ncbi:MAG: hypothetical protein KF849_18485 [Rhizobiaceae bacterium]|nr:hypothetical protein [Rhizobiaceae bacterium]
MTTETHMQVLNSSGFMYYADDADEARQQHVKAAVAYELAELALERATARENEEEIVLARGRWIKAMAKLRNATAYYLLTLSDGLANSPYGSLEDLIQHYLEEGE